MSPPQMSTVQPSFSILCCLLSESCFLFIVSEEKLLVDIIFSWNDITASKPSPGQYYHVDKRPFPSHVILS